MHAHALDVDLGSSSIEVLVFQIAQVTAVDGVCPVAAELLYIEVMGAHADFLVWIEAHADVSVLDFLMVAEVAHCLYDFSDARLVVCTEQGSSICYDDVLALVRLEFREFFYAGDDARTEFDILAVIILDDAGLDVFSAGIRTGVHVRDEADGRSLFLGIALQGGVDVAHIVHLYVAQTFFLQFVLQVLGKIQLFCRAWHTF